MYPKEYAVQLSYIWGVLHQSTVFQYFPQLLIIGTATSSKSAHASQKQLSAGMLRTHRPQKRGHTQVRHTSHAGRIPIDLPPLRRGPSARSWAHQVRHACAPGAIHVHVASAPRLGMKPFSLTATKVFSDILLLFLAKRRLWRSDECEGILRQDSRNITLGGGKVMCMR